MTTPTDLLFKSFSSEKLSLSNRIVMSPMTRSMSPKHIPGDDVAEYYRKRAAGGVGLIITEGTCIDHPAANGFNDVPFISSEEQLNG
jgi:2,4-dienoyl-CoA reductase-like NADH-dependent reductase (Old Yellow Enzyme family)